MAVEPCRRCGGRGEFTCRANPNKPHQIPCPRCEGMPKLAKPWTLMSLALAGQDWFFPDPDTVMWWCSVHESPSHSERHCQAAAIECIDARTHKPCEFGWVPRPDKPLEVVE